MRQGMSSGSSGAGKPKVEPRARKISPVAVNQIGAMIGNHITGEGRTSTGNAPQKLYQCRGFEAPHDAGRQIHKSGSQRRS